MQARFRQTMQARFRIVDDDISPMLSRAVRHVRDRRPLLRAGAQAIVSRAQGAFDNPSLRPAPWPARKRGSNPLLKKSGILQRSIGIRTVSNDFAVVGTDRPYAIYHQRGTSPYVIRPKSKRYLFWSGASHPVRKVNHPGLPARPFFPVRGNQLVPEARRDATRAMARVLAAKLGLQRDAFL
jgi:phage gpG-like protein